MTEPQTREQIYELIRPAILDRNILAVSYPGFIRELCPHGLGKTDHPTTGDAFALTNFPTSP